MVVYCGGLHLSGLLEVYTLVAMGVYVCITLSYPLESRRSPLFRNDLHARFGAIAPLSSTGTCMGKVTGVRRRRTES